MRCQTCHGTRVVQVFAMVPKDPRMAFAGAKGAGPRARLNLGRAMPCPDCNGSGVAHCCEGLQCQPEKE